MRRDPFETPLFFKLWFAFLAILAVTVLGLSVWFAVETVRLVKNPADVGRYIGEIQRGYTEKVK